MSKKRLFMFVILASLVSGITISGCKRKKADYLGPEYITAPDNLVVTGFAASSNVNFQTGACSTQADFSARVSYTITYRGLTSGAVKQYIGVSDKLDATVPGGVWNGSHDNLYFFHKGEQVEVTLSFLRSEVNYKDTITIQEIRNTFPANPQLVRVGGPLYFSYEIANPATGGYFPLQFWFSEAKNTADKFAFYALASDYGIKAIDGVKTFRIAGVSDQPNGYFVGGIQHRSNTTAFLLPTTWTDPSQIYFNVYLYGNGQRNTIVNLEFHESDATNATNGPTKKDCGGSTVGASGHDPCTDDAWVMAVPIDFTGWRLVSFRYSDFLRSGEAGAGGSGNNQIEPIRVARIQLGVVSTPAFTKADVIFDYPVITYGAPFDPTK
jgi:hypothetical protein